MALFRDTSDVIIVAVVEVLSERRNLVWSPSRIVIDSLYI